MDEGGRTSIQRQRKPYAFKPLLSSKKTNKPIVKIDATQVGRLLCRLTGASTRERVLHERLARRTHDLERQMGFEQDMKSCFRCFPYFPQ